MEIVYKKASELVPYANNASRKVCKTHQSVLVFFKGDPKTIKIEFGPAESVDSGSECHGPEND